MLAMYVCFQQHCFFSLSVENYKVGAVSLS